MNIKKTIPAISLVSIMCLCLVSNAQPYYRITHLTGIQNINGINVTVTPSGSASSLSNYCGAGPYWIGMFSISGPGNYRFAFSRSVSRVRIQVAAINNGEIISFWINGVPYVLTASNLSPYPGTCGLGMAAIAGGNLVASGLAADDGGEVTISGVLGGISSVEVHANGAQNGTIFSIYFGGISVYSNSPVCEGDTLKLFILPNDISGAIYSWTGPGGFASNVQNPVIPDAVMTHEGMYIATVTTSTDTFTDSTYVTIMPTPVTEIVYDEPVCAGKELMLSDTTTFSGVSYQWKGPNGFNASIANPVIPNVQPFHSGVYTLTTTLGECSYTAEATLNVLQPSHHSFTEVVCPHEEYDFNGRLLTHAGIYYDTLVAANGCDSIVTLHLVTLPLPEINISVEHETTLCIGDTVLVTTTGAITYQWYSNGHLRGNSNREYVYLPYLSNKVFVIGQADNGCSDTAEVVIHANACCELFIPNAFSPNGDGINDRFIATPHGHIRSYRMQIFNRWGQLMFAAFDINNQWDGTYNGTPTDAGTYFYHITAQCIEGTEINRKGEVALIR